MAIYGKGKGRKMSEPIGNTEQLPVAWIEHHKGGDNLNWEEVNHPYAKATPLYAHPPIKQSSLAEPVAIRYDFDGYGYLYMDAGSGSDWASRVKDSEFLYTHPMRELTDEEIMNEWYSECCPNGDLIKFARAIIKASRGEK